MWPLFFLLFSCAHKSKVKENHIVAGSCQDTFKETKLGAGQEIWEKVSEGTGTGMSYLVTGLGYSTDIAISFTGGVVAGIAACSPLIALDALASQGRGGGGTTANISGECIGKAGFKTAEILNPHLGPKTFKGTTGWRCPNVDPVAEGLVSVAECYEHKGEVKLSQSQLQNIVNSSVFQTCLTPKTMQKIEKKLESFPKL